MFHKLMGKHDKKDSWGDPPVEVESPPKEPKEATQADAPAQQAFTATGKFAIDRFFLFGGTSVKKSKRLVITLTGPAGPLGSVANKILATDLGFKAVESCSNATFQNAAGSTILILPAAVSLDGSYIVINGTDTAGGVPADITLSTNDTLQITVDGY